MRKTRVDDQDLRVLWVDDDNDDEGLLGGLVPHFQARGVEPVRAHGYRDGKVALERVVQESGAGRRVALLCDVVLPQELGMGALAWDLGFHLAGDAAEVGVKRIGFLTVVEMEEVVDGLSKLRGRGCDCEMFSKPAILDGNNIARMINFLLGARAGADDE